MICVLGRRTDKAAFHPSTAHKLHRNRVLVLEARRKQKYKSKESGDPLAGISPQSL